MTDERDQLSEPKRHSLRVPLWIVGVAVGAIVIIAVLATLLLTRSGGADGESAPSHRAIESLAELKSAYESAGGACSSIDTTSGDGVVGAQNASEVGICEELSALLSVFPDRASALAGARAQILYGQIASSDPHALVGPNWVIESGASAETFKQYQSALGGIILDASS